MGKKKITIKVEHPIVPREGHTGTGLVKMDYDHPEKDAIKVKKPKNVEEFKPGVSYELVPDQRGGFVERPRVEYPDFKPIVNVKDVATTDKIDKKQIQQFMKEFIESRNPKRDPYAQRNPADFSPPKIEVAGNDGIHVWLEVYKYGRQTTERICKHMGAYTEKYTLTIITLLINAAYFFKYKDGTIDCIPDTIRDKIIPPDKERQKEIKQEAKDKEDYEREQKDWAEGKNIPPELRNNPKFRVVEIVEEEDYAKEAAEKSEKKKLIIRSKTSKERKDEESFDIPDDETEAKQ